MEAQMPTMKGRTFEDFEALLKGRTEKKLGNNTWIHRGQHNSAPCLNIVLHRTTVVKVFKERGKTIIEFNTGGWKTNTTRARLNAFAPEGWAIVQRKHEWHWWQHGAEKMHAPFEDFDRFADGEFVIQEKAAR